MTSEQYGRRATVTVETGKSDEPGQVPGERRVMTIVAKNTVTLGTDIAAPREEPPAPEYADVEAALGQLRTAVDAAIAIDQAQTQSVIATLSRAFPGLMPFVLPQVQEASTAITQAVVKTFADVERITKERLAPHAEVPAKLETERDTTRTQGDALVAMAAKVTELTKTEGWAGEAAEGYRRAAIVQASALEELGGVEISSSNALDRAALLNRAAFFYATEAISFTAKQVEVAPGGDSAQLYARTRRVDGELHALAAKLSTELDAIGVGQIAEALAADLTKLLETPAVLQPTGWPTGGSAADTKPAPTATVIPAAD